MEIEVQYILINEYGEYRGEIMVLNTEQCEKVVELSKKFYDSGFEMNCEDGSFVVFPHEVTKKSILKINRKVINR
jgi:hypothetical protein